MVDSVSEVISMLKSYASRDLTLRELRDQLSLSLQLLLQKASDEDIELLSDLHSAMYEIEDGVLDEEEFRQAVVELLKTPPHSPIITVGQAPPQEVPDYSVESSTSTADLRIKINAA